MVLYCHASIFCCSTDLLTIFPRSSTGQVMSTVAPEATENKRGHSRCVLSTLVSMRMPLKSQQHREHSLARIPLPPDCRDSHVGRILHHVPVRDAGGVEHGLDDRDGDLVSPQSPTCPRSRKSAGQSPLVPTRLEHGSHSAQPEAPGSSRQPRRRARLGTEARVIPGGTERCVPERRGSHGLSS